MKYFPLGVHLQGKPCLVVGGGAIALRKVKALLKAGAKVSLVSPVVGAELEALRADGKLQWHKNNFENAPQLQSSEGLKAYSLVIAATNDDRINRQLGALAEAAGVLVNSASNVDDGNALLPAVIERGDVTVALHSNGQSPTITRYLKRHLEAFIPSNFGILSQWAESWRERVKLSIDEQPTRRRFWQSVLTSPIKDLALAGKLKNADQKMTLKLAAAQKGDIPGQVFLVGAGPGDPDLLTVKALKLIQQSQVVLYDRLVSPEIMALLPESAEQIYVGKRMADHAVPQQNINQLLVDLAKQGKQVLRLKGGDPFIFGRGGEELELLADQGVSFQVVPGITAASGCASYAGIPLTHRDHAQSVRFVTGHLKDASDELNWSALAQPNQTLVFYMGLTELPNICRKLIDSGASGELSAAIVEKGTTASQRVLIGTLDSLPELATEQSFKAPTLVIVGTVVQLHDRLAWYQ